MPKALTESRVWYRHRISGQRGYLCIRGGEKVIRLDRENQVIDDDLTSAWVPERKERPLNGFQVAQVAFIADRALCKFLGQPQKKSAWIEMLDEERIAWMTHGPGEDAHPLRIALFVASTEALETAAIP